MLFVFGFIDFFEKCIRCFSKQDICPSFYLNYVIGFLGYLSFIYEACGINSLKVDWAGRTRRVEGQSVRMSVRWETEGLQTVGIVCLVIMFLKLMHLLGLIDITEAGERKREELATSFQGLLKNVVYRCFACLIFTWPEQCTSIHFCQIIVSSLK